MFSMKSYTDLEQSRKLIKILPFKSADMYIDTTITPYFIGFVREDAPRPVTINDLISNNGIYPCWSLAALFEALDDEITDEEGNDYTLTIVKENLQYQLYYRHAWDQTEDIETDYYDDMVDACYEMIIKLHEQNFL